MGFNIRTYAYIRNIIEHTITKCILITKLIFAYVGYYRDGTSLPKVQYDIWTEILYRRYVAQSRVG